MPKYRKQWVKIVESYDFNDMPDDFHRVFWMLLPLQVSRDGTIPADAVLIRSKVFPLRRDVTCEQIDAALAWYAGRDMIRYYEVEGRRYLWAVNFAKYQGVTTKESASDYPAPPAQWPQDARPSQELVESRSGVGQELVESKSSTDAICNMQYAEAEADAKAVAEKTETPPPPPPQPEVKTALLGDLIEQQVKDEGWEMTPALKKAVRGLVDQYPDRQLWDVALAECATNSVQHLKYLTKCLETASRKAKGETVSSARDGDAPPRLSAQAPPEWDLVLGALNGTMTRQVVDQWLRPCQVTTRDHTLQIAPTSTNAREWIQHRLAGSLTAAVEQSLGDGWGWEMACAGG